MIIPIKSFSDPSITYQVDNLAKTCTCMAFKLNPQYPCKHLDLILYGRKPPKPPKTNKKSTKAKFIAKKVGLIPPSLLKSAIQKAVRRCDVNSAVICSKYFLDNDPIQFLRRWLIIIIEDSILHPSYGKIANVLKRGGTSINKDEKEMIINCVAEVAGGTIRDIWVTRDKPYIDDAGRNVIDEGFHALTKTTTLPDDVQELLEGINYRTTIGGMAGDMIFMRNYYRLWLDRFVNLGWTMEKLKSYFTPTNIKYDEVKPFTKDAMLIEGADFHCTPLLRIMLKKQHFTNLITQYYPEKVKEYGIEKVAKGILWRQMSCINYKEMINGSEKIQDVWYHCEIGKEFDKPKDEIIFSKVKEEIYNIMKWYMSKVGVPQPINNDN
jgi:hypothetical protein